MEIYICVVGSGRYKCKGWLETQHLNIDKNKNVRKTNEIRQDDRDMSDTKSLKI